MNVCLRLFVLFLALTLPFFVLAANIGDVIFNEIAWMGTNANSADEWIELKNNTGGEIDLAGWGIYKDAGATLIISLNNKISSNGYYLIERSDDNTVSDILADDFGPFSGNGLKNSGEYLVLKDNLGNIIDEFNFSGGWPAGIASPDYKSMERGSANDWQTNDGNIRNGKDVLGNLINGTPKFQNSNYLSISTPSPTPEPSLIITPSPILTPLVSPLSTSQIQIESSVVSTPLPSTSPSPLPSPIVFQSPLSDIISQPTFDSQVSAQSGGSESFDSEVSPADNEASPPNGEASNIPKIYINELLPNPKGDDKINEWIEIYNNSSALVDLSGFILEDASGKNFVFPSDKKIEPNDYLVVYGPETKVSLNNNGDLIKLFSSQKMGKKLISEVRYESVKEGYSVVRNLKGQYVQTMIISPGAVNVIKEPQSKDGINEKILNESAVNINEEKENNNYSENEKFLAKNPLINKNILFKPLLGGILILLGVVILSLIALFKGGVV